MIGARAATLNGVTSIKWHVLGSPEGRLDRDGVALPIMLIDPDDAGGGAEGDAGEHAHEYFDAGVSEQFLEASIGNFMFLKEFVDNNINNRRLLACCAPDRGGVEHGDDGVNGGEGKNRGSETISDADCRCQAGYGGRVGAWHSACADEVMEIDTSRFKKSEHHLYGLCEAPRKKGAEKPNVS